MSRYNRGSWVRGGTEAVVVVGSILMAFGIQAWWDGRSDRDLRAATLQGLLADFVSVDTIVSSLVTQNQKIVASHSLLISELRGRSGAPPVMISDTLLIAAFSSPTYNPPRTAVEMALGTGRLAELEDEPLRRLLAQWLQELDDTVEDELAAIKVVENKLVPFLASIHGFVDVLPHTRDWGFGELSDSVARSTRLVEPSDEFIGLLAVRMAHTRQVVRELSRVAETQREIVDLLGAAMTGR